MPISIYEFTQKSSIELDMHSSKVKNWMIKFLDDNKNNAYNVGELEEAVPKEYMANIKVPKSAITNALATMVAKGFVTRKGSYYIRTPQETIEAKKRGRPKKN